MPPSSDLDAALQNLIQRDVVQVPPYPAVAMRLQQLVAGGKYGTYDVARIAATDPVVTAYLLKAANSAAVRGTAKIASVSEAVARLGAVEVVRIALAASLGAEATRKGPLVMVRRRIWQEALAGALVSFNVASIRGAAAQEAFVCGLLHDVGRVVAVTCLEALLARTGDTRQLPEHDWLGIADRAHIELGRIVAAKWNLPEMLQTVVVAHHTPEQAGAHRAMAEVVYISDQIVHLLVTEPLIDTDMLTAIGLSDAEAARLTTIVPTIGAFVAGLEEMTGTTMPGADILSQVLTATAPRRAPAAAAAAAAEPRREKGFPAKVIRNTGEVEAYCIRITSTGLDLTVREKLPDKYLVKFCLYPPGGTPFDVHAFVESCHPSGEGFDVTARLFGVAGPLKDKWHALLATVSRAA